MSALDLAMEVCRRMGWHTLGWHLYAIQWQRDCAKHGIPCATFTNVHAAADWMVKHGAQGTAEQLAAVVDQLRKVDP